MEICDQAMMYFQAAREVAKFHAAEQGFVVSVFYISFILLSLLLFISLTFCVHLLKGEKSRRKGLPLPG